MLKKTLIASFAVLAMTATASQAQSPADLNDLEIAHVAYTADNIDIRYAHLALAKSQNPSVLKFARTMIRDHEAVNGLALGLLKKLKAQPKDNFLSQKLNSDANEKISELSKLDGAAFDNSYAENELGYHKAVNGLVGKTFIPNIDNAQVKALFKKALVIFTSHQKNAEKMVKKVMASKASY